MEPTRPEIVYPRRQAIRSVMKNGIAAAFAVMMKLDVSGKENLPKTGPLVIVANHFHFLDPVAMIRLLPYPAEYLGGPRTPNAPGWTENFRQFYRIVQIQRGASSRDGLLAAQSILRQKGVMCIFPEGGSWASVLRPARPGAALLAARAGAPLIPVGIDGLTDVFPALAKGRRAHVHIRFGKPFGPFDLSSKERSYRQQLDDFGHEIMQKIAELLPPERRGYYSSDPAIREAARGTEIYPWADTVEE